MNALPSTQFGLRYLLVAVTLCAFQMSALSFFGARALAALPLLGALAISVGRKRTGHIQLRRRALRAGLGGAAGVVLADLLTRRITSGDGFSVAAEGWDLFFAYALLGGAAFFMFAIATAVVVSSTTDKLNAEQKVIVAAGWIFVAAWIFGIISLALDPYLYFNGERDDSLNIASWYLLSLVFGTILAFPIVAIVVTLSLGVIEWRNWRRSRNMNSDK